MIYGMGVYFNTHNDVLTSLTYLTKSLVTLAYSIVFHNRGLSDKSHTPAIPRLCSTPNLVVTPRMLRSSSERRLALLSVQARHSRLFSFVVPRWWNELPSTTRAGASLSTFKKLLKTQLFREHFPS